MVLSSSDLNWLLIMILLLPLLSWPFSCFSLAIPTNLTMSSWHQLNIWWYLRKNCWVPHSKCAKNQVDGSQKRIIVATTSQGSGGSWLKAQGKYGWIQPAELIRHEKVGVGLRTRERRSKVVRPGWWLLEARMRQGRIFVSPVLRVCFRPQAASGLCETW